MKPPICLCAAVLFLAGCAPSAAPLKIGNDHPASPDGPAAPMPPPTNTLAIGESSQAGPPNPTSEMQHDAGRAMGHDGQVAQPLYACPMHPEVTSTNPNEVCPKCNMKINKRVKQAPASQASAGQQPVYACPMHPEVTSTNRDDRCPKCKMKINKLVTRAAAPKAASSAPAGGSRGHGGEHGGH